MVPSENKMNKVNHFILFNNGWRLPNGNYETFSESPKWFFKLGDGLSDERMLLKEF